MKPAKNSVVEVYVDGACNEKNPGGTPVWGCLFMVDGVPLDTSQGLATSPGSENANNAVAEYQAFIKGLQEAGRRWKDYQMIVYTDNPLVYGQVEEGKPVRPANLANFHRKAMKLKESFKPTVKKIGHSENKVAHRIAWSAYLEQDKARQRSI